MMKRNRWIQKVIPKALGIFTCAVLLASYVSYIPSPVSRFVDDISGQPLVTYADTTNYFGYNSIGTANLTMTTNWANIGTTSYGGIPLIHTAGVDETLTTITVYAVRSSYNATAVHVGLYTVSGGVPVTRIWDGYIGVNVTANWYSVSMSQALTSGTTYCIAARADSSTTWLYTLTVANDLSYYNAADLLTPWNETAKAGWVQSVYATYTSPGAVAPTVVTNPTVSITDTTCNVSGNITATGGDNPSQIWFQYGTSTGIYSVNSTSTGNYSTGYQSFLLSGLTPATKYFGRFGAKNSNNTTWGSEVTWIQKPTPASNFRSTNNGTTSITWAWDSGVGVTDYELRYWYVTNPTDNQTHKLAYWNNGNSVTLNGLSSNYTMCASLFTHAFVDSTWVDAITYSTANATTLTRTYPAYGSPTQVAFIGDSIFYVTTDNVVGYHFGKLTGYTVTSYGVSGQTTDQIWARYPSQIGANHYDVVVDDGGLNDLYGSENITNYLNRKTDIFTYLQNSSNVSLVIELLMTPAATVSNADRTMWNNATIALSSNFSKVHCVDAEPYIGTTNTTIGVPNNLWVIYPPYAYPVVPLGVHFNTWDARFWLRR
ncbi:SGNH/GDSL hydrolase family protein [Candidatus Dojkabacteria bacterium]|jgi:hypothetical protein|nr:SGNH/GDSL hydrolase family protein [Candidatus Dojkabacteria bacterium]